MEKGLVIFGLAIIIAVTACDKRNLAGTREADDKKLEQLYHEIDSLAGLYACEDAEEWRFTPIGEKACGGPTGYLAYSIKLDTAYFLEKVETYTKLQKAYNKKWDVVSDCMYLMPPSHVRCEEGKPKLVWDTEFTNE
ncbi:hypothetical protein [Parapedobacter tibetensis]|uniref:hypothetical protein n=1 Tax=Parapedobacter tibetensis TaxID=2972951 RepID=UPI00214D244C|nr:hypothetical protein [Parapedobacter tibetensis]